jgi:ketosteroid isomerase-like protein
MALDNIEIVRRFIDLGVDEALAYADPNVVWNPVEEAPATGHAAVRASLERWKGEWEDYELIPEEFAALGDHVLMTVTMRGRGRGSGIEVAGRLYDLFTLEAGKIVRMDQFSEESEAREAARRA